MIPHVQIFKNCDSTQPCHPAFSGTTPERWTLRNPAVEPKGAEATTLAFRKGCSGESFGQ